MFKMIESPNDSVVAFHITAEVSESETDDMVYRVNSLGSPENKVRLFLVISQYTSFNSAEDFYDDLRFVRRCADRIERMAVVGDRSWKSTLVGLFGLFSSIETAYFDRSEFLTAWKWLNENLR
jgi:SpoIIAA-like